MENLTAQQIKEVKTLVRLGDSLELAIQTVLNSNNNNSNIYYIAYNL